SEEKQAASQGFAKCVILIDLLKKIQPRIKTKKPSKFLSTSLISLLGVFISASGVLPTSKSCAILDEIHEFLQLVHPDEGDHASPESSSEFALQQKLLQAFNTHL